MRLLVVSHKVCWPNAASPCGYATDGGFPFQMHALSSLFDDTVLCVPCEAATGNTGLTPLQGNLTVAPLTPLVSADLGTRRRELPHWLWCNLPTLWRAARDADAIHAPIPGDIGTFGIALAEVSKKPLFVRHCGNWKDPRTRAEHAWRRYMETRAGHRRVMMATGLGASPPSPAHPRVGWIFSTTVSERQLAGSPRMLSRQHLRLVIVARQEQLKGTDTVIEALAQLERSYPLVTLDVVGDGPDLERHRALAERLGISDRVKFHGQVEHEVAIQLVSQSDLFVFPSRASEGFPKVVGEAMAAGVPVVASATSSLPSILQDGGGIIVDPPSVDEVVRAVRQVTADPTTYATMSEAAIRTARRFTLEEWTATIEQRLERCWGPLRSQQG